MSDREKLLGIVVGSLLAFFAVFGVFRSVKGGLETRNRKVASTEANISKEEQTKVQGLQAVNLVNKYRARSLDFDITKAHLSFERWLKNQVEKAGLSSDLVRYNDLRKKTDNYKELTYTVSGEGSIRQINQLLYNVQAADTLHRVESIGIRPGTRSGKLVLDMTVAALSMGNTDQPKATVGEIAKDKLPRNLEEYQEAIAMRNLFAPANNAPKFNQENTKTVELGGKLEWQLKATDADDHDELGFELLDAPDDTAKLRRNRLVWEPEEVGEYEFQVQVTDDGLPAKIDEATLVVKVVPASKKEEPKKDDFDEATLARATGITRGSERGAEPELWLYLQSKDEKLSLVAGDKIDIGKWQGFVREVRPLKKMARLESQDGTAYELKLGAALSDAKPIN